MAGEQPLVFIDEVSVRIKRWLADALQNRRGRLQQFQILRPPPVKLCASSTSVKPHLGNIRRVSCRRKPWRWMIASVCPWKALERITFVAINDAMEPHKINVR